MKSCVVTQNKTRRRRLEGSGPAAERKDTGSHINTFTALSIRLACCRFSSFFFPWRVPFPCLTRNCCGDKVQIQLQGEFACIFPRLGNVLCIVFGFIRGCVFWRFYCFSCCFCLRCDGESIIRRRGKWEIRANILLLFIPWSSESSDFCFHQRSNCIYRHSA